MRLPKSVLLAHASCLVERHPGGEHRAPPVFVETEIWQLAILIAVGQYSFPLATQAAKGPDIVIWASIKPENGPREADDVFAKLAKHKRQWK